MFKLHIRSEQVGTYREAHANLGPEVVGALRMAGFRNYSIFIDGTWALGYYEADDVVGVWQRFVAHPAAQRWRSENRSRIVHPPTPLGPALLPEIFHLD